MSASENTESRQHARIWLALLLAHLAALLALGAWVAQQLKPVNMQALHLDEGERLKCVSYAPFRLPGQTPFDPDLRISREQIVADLTELVRITECVRIYSVGQGLEQVPEIAGALGLKVLLGAWISSDLKLSKLDLDRAIDIANRHPATVATLIVGNEVLLRRERTAEQMRELIAYAQARTEVPITYADVWEFWVRNQSLASAVDRVTVHILPFWEDQPVAVENAVAHVAAVLDEVRQHFDKPVMIGETGWPSAGRQREASQPSRVNQARYIREFVRRAHDQGWDYNLIEAIDQPWKRRLEGTVGGHWGILDSTLTPKFPLAGAVAERESYTLPALATLAGAALCLLLAAAGGRARPATLRLATAAATGAVGALVAALHIEHARLAYRDVPEWSVLGLVALLAALVPLLLARWNASTPIPSAAAAWQTLRTRASARCSSNACALSLIRGVLLFAAAVAAVLLFADPRYRDFPTLLYLAPTLVFGVTGWTSVSRHAMEERLCASVLALASIARWLAEPANPQAIAWLLTCLVFALPFLRRPAREHQ
ncbi:MAG: beta-1,6-glucan synthase [Rhodocyclales bacterium]|nr:beta-1,6-glucan synthase [Rhodocyclales bacterium]